MNINMNKTDHTKRGDVQLFAFCVAAILVTICLIYLIGG